LGAGSNLLISDRGLPGLVLNTRHLRSSCFDAETATITAAAGEPLPKIAWRAAKRGWRGLEWAVGIPGTVGGAVVMNAGAHTSCVADRLVRALVLNPDGQLETLSKEDLNYSYRSSSLQGDQRLVIEATFQLEATDNREEIMNFILNIGSAKASDILRLIRHVQEQVFDRWSLWLEPEVKFLGEFDGI